VWEAAVPVVNICKDHACTHSFIGKKICQQQSEEIADIKYGQLFTTEQRWFALKLLEAL